MPYSVKNKNYFHVISTFTIHRWKGCNLFCVISYVTHIWHIYGFLCIECIVKPIPHLYSFFTFIIQYYVHWDTYYLIIVIQSYSVIINDILIMFERGSVFNNFKLNGAARQEFYEKEISLLKYVVVFTKMAEVANTLLLL